MGLVLKVRDLGLEQRDLLLQQVEGVRVAVAALLRQDL